MSYRLCASLGRGLAARMHGADQNEGNDAPQSTDHIRLSAMQFLDLREILCDHLARKRPETIIWKQSEYKIEIPIFSVSCVDRMRLCLGPRFWHMLFISYFLKLNETPTGHQRPPGSPRRQRETDLRHREARGKENGSTREREERERTKREGEIGRGTVGRRGGERDRERRERDARRTSLKAWAAVPEQQQHLSFVRQQRNGRATRATKNKTERHGMIEKGTGTQAIRRTRMKVMEIGP